MQGVEGMDESRVSSDDRVNARCFTDFYGYGRLAYARVSTHCRRILRVAMNEWGAERKLPSICLLTVFEGSNTCSVLCTKIRSRFKH